MDRVTEKLLNAVCDRINRQAGTPMAPYKRVDGNLVGQIGNYHLDAAYGGWKLVYELKSIPAEPMTQKEMQEQVEFISGLKG